MDEGEYAPSRVLQVAKFADARTEAGFLTAYRTQGVRFAAVGLALGGMLALLVSSTHLFLDGDGQRALIRGWSYAWLSVILGGASWLAFGNPCFVIRHYLFAVGGPVIASTSLLCVFWWFRIEEQAAPYTHGATVMILALFVISAFGRLPTALVAGLAIVNTLAFILAIVMLSEPLLPTTIYMLLACFAVIALSVDIERRERANFRQLSLTHAASVAKSRVLASVSHDLRQPLGALSLYLGSLRNREGANDAAGFRVCVDRMGLCLQAMEGNLSRLLEIGRLQGASEAVALEHVDLRDLVHRVHSVYLLQATSARVVLDFDAIGDDARWGRTHGNRLFEIVSNLVHNALKFTQKRWPGGGGIVRIGVTRHASRISVCVEDNGPGIAPADHAKIFEEYVQIGNSERDHRKGYGLGLAVVRQMVNSLAGHDVSVRSAAGSGACFQVEFEASEGRASDDHRASSSATEESLNGFDFAGRLVIVVEDDVLVRDALVETLEAWGVEADTAESAAQARDMAGASDLLYDAIVTDWRLPLEHTGAEVIELVRRESGLMVPAIVITGELLDDRMPLEMPADVIVLRKPLGWLELRHAVSEAFGRSDALRMVASEIA